MTETWADRPEKPRLSSGRYFLRICAALIFVLGLVSYAFSVWFERRVERLVALSMEVSRFESDVIDVDREASGVAWVGDVDVEFRRRTAALEARFHEGVFEDRAADQVRLAGSLSRALRVIGEPVRALLVLERGAQVSGEVLAAAGEDAGALLDLELEGARVTLALGDPLEAFDGAWSVIEGIDEFDLYDSMSDARRHVDAWQVMGDAQSALGDFAGAVVSFETALEAASDGVPWWNSALHRRLADALEASGDFEHATAARRRAIDAAEKISDIRGARVALPTHELGRTLAKMDPSRRAEAVLALERSLDSRRESKCSDTRDHADHAVLLARLLMHEGDVRAARTHFDEAARMLERLHELDASAIASERDALVETKSSLRAEHDRQALELGFRERADSADSHAKVVNLNDLGRALRAQGKDREAEPYYRRALEMRRRLVSGDDRGVATLTNNLGLLRVELGEREAGFAQLEEALAMRRRLAVEDPDIEADVAQSLINIATVRHREDDYAEALRLEDESVAILKRVHAGADDADLAVAIDNRAATLADLGRIDEAIAGHFEALAMLRRLAPGDDVDVARTLFELGVCHALASKNEAALVHFSEALRMRRRLFGDDHDLVAETLESIGDLHFEMLEIERALSVRSELLAMRRRLGAANEFDTLRAALQVGFTHMTLGDPRSARPLFEEVVKECAPLVPRSLWTLSNGLEGLGRACKELGGFEDVAEVITAADRALSTSSGGRSTHRAACCEAFAALYAAWNQIEPSPERALAAERWRTASQAK